MKEQLQRFDFVRIDGHMFQIVGDVDNPQCVKVGLLNTCHYRMANLSGARFIRRGPPAPRQYQRQYWEVTGLRVESEYFCQECGWQGDKSAVRWISNLEKYELFGTPYNPRDGGVYGLCPNCNKSLVIRARNNFWSLRSLATSQGLLSPGPG